MFQSSPKSALPPEKSTGTILLLALFGLVIIVSRVFFAVLVSGVLIEALNLHHITFLVYLATFLTLNPLQPLLAQYGGKR